MKTTVTIDDLRQCADFDAANQRVQSALDNALQHPAWLVSFLGWYIDWNGWFGSGVATLAGELSRSRGIFQDADEGIQILADRSVHVASHFFDAARDEFDDSATPHRDTHRTLAQATLKGLVEVLGLSGRANALLTSPDWLDALNHAVLVGYGHQQPELRAILFEAMGFHLGSELLADEEFTILDQTLRRQRPDLVDQLLQHKVPIAGTSHPAYYWIGIHSGVGGGVEFDHFQWAVSGVEVALQYTPEAQRPQARQALFRGFAHFARIHEQFFSTARQALLNIAP